MPEASLTTMMLQDCVVRWQGGDRTAADVLLRAARQRLEKLARRMCRSFPNVRAFAETGDVLQNSTVRLLRTLQRMRPATTRDFFNLAAVHIRRELIDLARHFKGRAHVSLDRTPAGVDSSAAGKQPHSPDPSPDFDLWCVFHQAVEELPPEEREVVGLVFYHGWTQAQIGELLDVDERTVRRRWTTACDRLRTRVGSAMPGG